MDPGTWQSALLIFARVSAFMAVGPLFGLRPVPPLLKAGAALILASLLVPVVRLPEGSLQAPVYALAILGEVLVGLALGYAASLLFHAFRVAGQLLDLETGLAMANLLDPETGAGVSLLGEFFYLLGLWLLLQMDGHHSLLRALADSFELVPPGTAAWQGALAAEIGRRFAAMFGLALRLAAPVMAVLVVSDVALALISRTVPQLNVFMMGFPLKVGLGLLGLILVLPILAQAFGPVVKMMEESMAVVSRYLVGA
ncbi:MAG: flagellar biosynthetic protein FliR [Clostridia bacterium]|nr:flagellar biosynthetic protein FliR [Clostridia bacterium]MDH7573468.1 flagellar biosynthetic protein FliR [Clostridia bacterium]